MLFRKLVVSGHKIGLPLFSSAKFTRTQTNKQTNKSIYHKNLFILFKHTKRYTALRWLVGNWQNEYSKCFCNVFLYSYLFFGVGIETFTQYLPQFNNKKYNENMSLSR